jgi:hypothetical protein
MAAIAEDETEIMLMMRQSVEHFVKVRLPYFICRSSAGKFRQVSGGRNPLQGAANVIQNGVLDFTRRPASSGHGTGSLRGPLCALVKIRHLLPDHSANRALPHRQKFRR